MERLEAFSRCLLCHAQKYDASPVCVDRSVLTGRRRARQLRLLAANNPSLLFLHFDEALGGSDADALIEALAGNAYLQYLEVEFEEGVLDRPRRAKLTAAVASSGLLTLVVGNCPSEPMVSKPAPSKSALKVVPQFELKSQSTQSSTTFSKGKSSSSKTPTGDSILTLTGACPRSLLLSLALLLSTA